MGIKCVATMDGGSDDWCTNSCNDPSGITNPSATTCPTKLCVCDWKGEWPVEDTGEVNWADTKSLGVGGAAPNEGGEDAAIARAVAKSLGADANNNQRSPGHIRGPNGAAEASRTSFRETAPNTFRHKTTEESTSSADSTDASASRDGSAGTSAPRHGGHRHGPKWEARYGDSASGPDSADAAADTSAPRHENGHR